MTLENTAHMLWLDSSAARECKRQGFIDGDAVRSLVNIAFHAPPKATRIAKATLRAVGCGHMIDERRSPGRAV